MENIEIRRQILKRLYEMHDHDPYEVISVDHLSDDLTLPLNRVISNLLYLADKDKNFVCLTRTYLQNGYAYDFAKITASGIDLVDDPSEFNSLFPPQVVYQYIAGDNFEVTIGDNASQVVVGKDIASFSFSARHPLERVLQSFVESIDGQSSVNFCELYAINDLIDELNKALNSECIDLGKVQSIKESLVQYGGYVTLATAALFSHPSVVKLIMRSVENLIGRS